MEKELLLVEIVGENEYYIQSNDSEIKLTKEELINLREILNSTKSLNN